MAGSLQLAGAQPQKNPRFTTLYQGRWSTGLVTQRAPVRSAASAYEERYIGSRMDALIDGSNCEVTPKLTLARRPGNPVYNSNTFAAVNSFYSFREFNSNTEQIRVMADTASILYDATAGGQITVFNKTAGSGQTFMQSVGNTLYFGNGVDQKKWVQSLVTRTSSASGSPNIGNSVTLNAAQFPFVTTFLIDPNGNLQQLLATQKTTVTNVQYVNSTNTLTLTVGSTAGIAVGNQFVIWDLATATWLNGATIQVTVTPVGVTLVCKLVDISHADYTSAADTGNLTLATGGTPTTGGTVPTWNTTVPASGNNYLGGITIDGTAVWVNRGNPVENWGIVAGTSAPTVSVGASTSAWKASTFFSLAGAVVDTQFGGQTNIWQVTAQGKSGSSNPFTTNPTSGTTTVTDGGVTWKCVASTHTGDAAWAAHTTYSNGHLIVEPAGPSSVNSLFQLQYVPTATQFVQNAGIYVSAYIFTHNHSFNGQCDLFFPTALGSALASDTGGNSVLYDNGGGVAPLVQQILNGAGESTGTRTPFPAYSEQFNMMVQFTLNIPQAGQYSFNISHDDGMYFGISTGISSAAVPIYVSGPKINLTGTQATVTAVNGYTTYGGNNVSGSNTDTYTVQFPSADTYTFEIDYCNWEHAANLNFKVNGVTPIPGTAETSASSPVWPAFSTAFAPNYANVQESQKQYQWNNLGPITDSVWQANTGYTLPNTTITDPNNNTEAPFRAGVSGTKIPTFSTGINQLTNDNPNLIWINQGPASAPAPGTLSTFNGGWQYCVGLGNSLVNAASNASPLSATTGNFIGAAGVTITGGIPALAKIDSQSDEVFVFRTTDGLTTPFLIPGTTNLLATIPLATYLADGYLDTTPDTGLNNLIQAPILGENTPPALGAQNLTYHLSRIWFSVGNVVYWTSGPVAPIGNGIEGVLPTNNQTFPSLVKRIVATTVGAFIFTVSDVFIITGQGTTTSPIQPAYPYAPGLGLLSYNALDIFGSSIGFFATDKTFNVLDISSGPSEVGFNIGDKLQTSQWNPSNVYVTWHSSGEDKAWFVSDGATGWYRISVTPSPEQGVTISPFATITGGCKAVTSIETLPGTHQLLVGPTSSGPILARSLTTFQDNVTNYTWFAVIGSLVLANSGEVAQVSHLSTQCNAIGTRPSLSVILDESIPTYTGPFEELNYRVSEPPNLPESTSMYKERFYLDQTQEPAACHHCQIRIDFPAENLKNEAYTIAINGCRQVEK